MMGRCRINSIYWLLIAACFLATRPARGAYIWIEGESPTHATVTRHPWWYDKVQKNKLSGGDYISNWDASNAGQLIYNFESPADGEYQFWVRANPVQSTLLYRLNGAAWTPIDTQNNLVDSTNIAENNAVDIRFIAWMKVGKVALKKGANTVMFRMDSKNNHHGSIDCFVFSSTPFQPQGILKPDEMAPTVDSDAGWFPFNPAPDTTATSTIDLRSLNEKSAGDGGFIAVHDGEFIHGKTGEAVRFWGVNGPPADLNDLQALRQLAHTLAKRGVNLVRIHGGYFDEAGEIDPKKVQHAIDVVRAMKAEGIYCHFSAYYYAWLHPKPGTPWLPGYDGNKTPPGALFINPDFQSHYMSWWKALLLTPDAHSGQRLIDDPAVASLEILNEDSLLFWTFSQDNLPPQEWEMAEREFCTWVKNKYGSMESAANAWNHVSTDRDAYAAGRLGIRPMWQILKEKTVRDQDTIQFLADTERGFYQNTERQLRDMGFKGVITASNWIAADPSLLPLEKYINDPCDFFDRHGYVAPDGEGDSVDWSLRDGQTYIDRSAQRFDPHQPGQPRPLSSPVMDPHFDGKPSMLSEVAISRPSRYRSEAPLYFAAYGSLQKSNAIEHFALDGHTWSVKPNYFMQPWSVMSPATLGQFPAAALIYRKRLIDPGKTLAEVSLKMSDLTRMDGGLTSGLLSEIDENHAVVSGGTVQPNEAIDPLACFAGQTQIHFTDHESDALVVPLAPLIDRNHRTVTSTNGQLRLDYENGIMVIDAPSAQGVSGNLAKAGTVKLANVTISSPLDLAHVVIVSLDDKPLSTSSHMLLQVMSEERATGFQTAPAGNGRKRIVSIGHDPWLVRELAGSVKLERPDAAQLSVIPLDGNGFPLPDQARVNAASIALIPDVIYYDIHR